MRPKPPTVALYVSGHGFGHDPDTTSPPQADFPLSALNAGQPKGCPYIVVCLCRDWVYPCPP